MKLAQAFVCFLSLRERIEERETGMTISFSGWPLAMPVNMKIAQQRTVPLALREITSDLAAVFCELGKKRPIPTNTTWQLSRMAGCFIRNGGEGTIMAGFIMGGFLAMIVK